MTFEEQFIHYDSYGKAVTISFERKDEVLRKVLTSFHLDCTACGGRCCGGFFFKGIRLTRAEKIRFKRKVLPEPCEFFKDGLCVIYAERPETCKDYPLFMHKRYFNLSISCPEARRLQQLLAQEDDYYRIPEDLEIRDRP